MDQEVFGTCDDENVKGLWQSAGEVAEGLDSLVIAAVALAVCQSAFFSAVASTGVATGTVVALGTASVVTGLCAAAVFGERLTPRRWRSR